MNKAEAPNQRLETVSGQLDKELTGASEEEKLFKLL
jgi:hypothetical protein